ncbi:MAG: WD40 repeat domain-containing protein [Gemmataceae bacterium]
MRVGPAERVPVALTPINSAIATSAGGDVLTASITNGALVWQRDRPHEAIILGPHDDCRTVAVSPDGRLVATGAHNGPGLKVWEARTGKLLKSLLPDRTWTTPSFSSDGLWLFNRGGESWRTEDWSTGKKYPGEVTAFCPADLHLGAWGGKKGEVLLFDPTTGQEHARLEDPHQDGMLGLTFSPDGSLLIGTTDDGRCARAWDLRRIRQGLRNLGLDWEAPPFAPSQPEPTGAERLLSAEIDIGDMQDDKVIRPWLSKQQLQGLIDLNSLTLTFQPSNWKAFRQRGRAYGTLKDFRAAIRDFSAGLALLPAADPNRFELFRRRAGYQLILRDYDKALADIRDAEQIDPFRGPEIRRAQATFLVGRSLNSKEGDPPAALQDLRKAVEIDPKHGAARNNLAWLLLSGPTELRNTKEALSHARAAVEASETQEFLNTLGVANYRNEKYSEAVQVLEKSLVVGKGQFDAFDLYFLAMCHSKLDDPAKAIDCYDRAVKWVESRKDLPARYGEELKAFRAEAEEVMRLAKRR